MKSKICKECGKEFTPKSGTQIYCKNPHHTTCKICGKDIEYTCSPNEKPLYCSKECRNEGKRRTVNAKYGVDNVSQLQEVKDKIGQRNSSDEVRAKRENTCLEKYGVSNVSQAPEIKSKLSEVMRSYEYLHGREMTCLEKYGHHSPMQHPDVKAKRASTNMKRYGAKCAPRQDNYYANVNTDPSKYEEYIKFKSDPKTFILNNYNDKPTIRQLELDLGVTNTPIYNILIKFDCQDMIAHNVSCMEIEVIDYIHAILSDTKVVHNDREIIKPYELDIYLPEYGLAIECNPTATHNSSMSDPWGMRPKHYMYHKHKSELCKNRDIFLFHIFGYEWTWNKDVIKSMISNLLGVTKNKIYARNTYVCEVSHNVAKEFLDSNHRQGMTSAKIRLGLKSIVNDELVALMTFNKVRPTIGQTGNSNAVWELSRFCSKIDTNVIGGASKLFKYFTNNYTGNIVSFSDIAHTKGLLYEKLGFRKVSESSPGYVWVDINTDMYKTRVSCQKQNLPILFNEPDLDITTQTEAQIMESHKYVRVYDCGVIRWEYSS